MKIHLVIFSKGTCLKCLCRVRGERKWESEKLVVKCLHMTFSLLLTKLILKKEKEMDFPGGPVVKTSPSNT